MYTDSSTARAVSLSLLAVVSIITAPVAFVGHAAAASIVVNDTGGADYTTIQAAVTAASPGDRIVVKPGTYNESVAVTTPDLEIVGQGNRRSVLDGGDSRFAAFTIQARGVTIRNVQIQRYSIGVFVNVQDTMAVQDIAILDNTFSDIRDIGIAVNAAGTDPNLRDVTLRNNRISLEGSTTVGIHVIAQQAGMIRDVAIRDNHISNASAAGLALLSQITSSTPLINGISITDNRVTESAEGLSLAAANGTIENVSVEGNAFENNDEGIDVAGYTTGTYSSIAISDNVIRDNGVGIVVRADVTAAAFTVTANEISDNSETGLLSRTTNSLDAEGNDWGAATGPFNLQRNPAGDGDSVAGNVDFDPWTPDFVELGNGSITTPHDNVTLELVAHSDRAAGYQATITFDPRRVDAVTVHGGDPPFSSPSILEKDLQQGRIRLRQTTGTSPEGPTVLARITFNGSLVTSPDDLGIDATIFAEDGTEIGDAVASAKDARLLGDVDANGMVGPQDVALVNQKVAGSSVRISDRRADVNRDGQITTTDAALIQRILDAIAFEDADHDGDFDPSVDTRIPDGELADGQYDTGENGLVIPAGFGPLTAERIRLSGNGVWIGVDLTATTHSIRIDATSRRLHATDIELDAAEKARFETDDRINLSGSTVAGTQIKAESGAVLDATDLTADADKKLEFESDGELAVPRSMFDGKKLTIEADGSLDATDLTVTADRQITVESRGTMNIAGSTLQGQRITHETGGDLIARNATLDGSKKVMIESDDAFSGSDIRIRSRKQIDVEADGDIDLSDGVVNAEKRIVLASGGDIDIRGTTLDAKHIVLEAEGDVLEN